MIALQLVIVVVTFLAVMFAGVLAAAIVTRVHAGMHRRRLARPHRVDNPGGNRVLPPAWGTWAAAIERVPASVRDEFLPASERVDRREFATGGVLLVPDDVEVTDLSSVVPLVIRTSRPEAVRVTPEAPVYPSTRGASVLWSRPPPPRGPGAGTPVRRRAKAARDDNRKALRELRAQNAALEATVKQLADAVRDPNQVRGVLRANAVRVALEAQQRVPRQGPRPSPGRPGWH